MDKNVKGWVIIIAWLHIGLGLVGLAITLFRWGKFFDIGAPFQIGIGAGLLLFKEWARKGIIIFSVIVIIAMGLLIINNLSFYYEPSDDISYTQYAQSVIVENVLKRILAWLIVIFNIYFFTHPMVRKEFAKAADPRLKEWLQ
jgi:hypothetical protein